MPMMNPLRLSPLPTLRADDESSSLLMEREGFVDEAVVTALVNGNLHPRSVAYPEDLALAADDSDFAGWRLSTAVPVRSAEVPPQVIDAIVRRAAPPVIGEPRLGSPHRGNHRWWLTGLAGILSTMLFAVLLLTLSARSGSQFGTLLSPKMLPTAKPTPEQNAAPATSAPELTEISPLGR